jgi:hypothetical protein
MKIKHVCEKCGSEEVFVDAYAEWDVDTQSWELVNLRCDWCVDCDGETNIIEQEIKETTS